MGIDRPALKPTSYEDVVAYLGEGTLLTVSADGRTRSYQWNGGGSWGRLEATFRDGYLISKKQFALRNY